MIFLELLLQDELLMSRTIINITLISFLSKIRKVLWLDFSNTL